MEQAVLFFLLKNWSAGAHYRVWDDLSFETENPLISISTLDILSSISTLICHQNGTKVKSQTSIDFGIKYQISTLLSLSDDILVMGFLWRSMPRNRIFSREQMRLDAAETTFKSWMTRIFKEFSV
jgi:hypothetical protein